MSFHILIFVSPSLKFTIFHSFKNVYLVNKKQKLQNKYEKVKNENYKTKKNRIAKK